MAMWSWAICTDTCAICRNNLYEPSIEYQANPTGDTEHPGLSIAWGTCGHVFHLDCIQRWLKTRSACPLCSKEWEFSKIEKVQSHEKTYLLYTCAAIFVYDKHHFHLNSDHTDNLFKYTLADSSWLCNNRVATVAKRQCS